MAGRVPVIDFAAYSLNVDENSVTDLQLKTLASDFYNVLSTVGFCYIQNHGIQQENVNELFRISKKFFDEPREVKDACESHAGRFNGYQALEKERVSVTRPGDLKETFNYTTCAERLDIKFPVSVPGMEGTFDKFLKLVTQLSYRVLDVMSLSLNMGDRNYLRKRHNSLGGDANPGTLRSIHYPPLPDDGSVKPGQLRCGEHTDYGTLALLFQDSIGGLEIQMEDGQFVPVPPIEGTVVVNIGDLMQRWTGDQLKATVHRVVIPEVELRRKSSRQSAVLFVDPDDHVMIECMDGSNKYPPITSGEFVTNRITGAYK